MNDHIKASTMADDKIYDSLPANPSVLKRVLNCKYCGAKRFQFESPAWFCRKGKIVLATNDVPDDLICADCLQANKMMMLNILESTSVISTATLPSHLWGLHLPKVLQWQIRGVYIPCSRPDVSSH